MRHEKGTSQEGMSGQGNMEPLLLRPSALGEFLMEVKHQILDFLPKVESGNVFNEARAKMSRC